MAYNPATDKYDIVDGVTIKNDITISFVIDYINRDGFGAIVEVGGTRDLRTREIAFTGSWTDITGNSNSIQSSTLINDWETLTWKETTQADFTSGTTGTDTVVVNNSGGEIRLASALYNNWCNPLQSLTSYDLPGQGVAQSIAATPGKAYAGTGANSSSYTFTSVTITDTNPPVVNVLDTFDGYKANGIFGDPTYGYLATDNNAEEVVIIDISTNNFTKVGWFGASGSTDAEAVYVVDNVGYMTQGNKLRTFNLTSTAGSRAQLGTVTLSGTGTDIVVIGSYAYVSIAGATNEMEIYNVSNPASMSRVAWADINGQAASDLFVSADGNRVYIGTNSSTTQREFFIINTTSKSGSRPTIASYESNGMSVKGLTVIDNKAILVGSGGEEYQVVNVATETAPVRCGGMNIDSGLNGVASVNEASGNVYSYVISNDATTEFKVIKGGQGGGDANGVGYVSSGTYLSSVFDTTKTNMVYYLLEWIATVPTGTSLRFQMRSGSTSDLTAQPWYGPDGTASTYFTVSGNDYLPAASLNDRYIQYQALLTSDTVSTPLLQEIKLSYQEP